MTGEGSGAAAAVRVRLARELWFFAAPRNRASEITVRYDGTATVGHVVEALGVPLTEVGELLIEGTPVGPYRQPNAGATIEVRPVRRPQLDTGTPVRFVLDVHLGKLAHRLRLLGVDTAYDNAAADDELIEQSVSQHRVLLTQDRGLLRRRALWAGAYVRGSRPADQQADVLERFPVRLRPWTRCVSCNGELEPVEKETVAPMLRPGTWRRYDSYTRCLSCGRVFWRGAHARRLNAIIDEARAVVG